MLAFFRKIAVRLKIKMRQSRFVYVLSSNIDARDAYNDVEIRAVVRSRAKAHRLLVKNIKDYINSWHEGDDAESRTKESYFKEGFAELQAPPEDYGSPVIVEAWYLNESDTFVQYAITRLRES